MAKAGGDQREWATDQLLSRPALDPDLEPYLEAFLYLMRDRPFFSHPLGMTAGPLMQQKTPRTGIRSEGARRGYRGDDLDEFVELVAHCEDVAFAESFARQVAELKAALNNPNPGG